MDATGRENFSKFFDRRCSVVVITSPLHGEGLGFDPRH